MTLHYPKYYPKSCTSHEENLLEPFSSCLSGFIAPHSSAIFCYLAQCSACGRHLKSDDWMTRWISKSIMNEQIKVLHIFIPLVSFWTSRVVSLWPSRNQFNTQSIFSGILRQSCISSFQCIIYDFLTLHTFLVLWALALWNSYLIYLIYYDNFPI